MAETKLREPQLKEDIDSFLTAMGRQGYEPRDIASLLNTLHEKLVLQEPPVHLGVDVNKEVDQVTKSSTQEASFNTILSSDNSMSSILSVEKRRWDQIAKTIAEAEKEGWKEETRIIGKLSDLLNAYTTIGGRSSLALIIKTAQDVLTANGFAAATSKLVLKPALKARKKIFDVIYTTKALRNLEGRYGTLSQTKFDDSNTYVTGSTLGPLYKKEQNVTDKAIEAIKKRVDLGKKEDSSGLSQTVKDFLKWAAYRNTYGNAFNNIFDVSIFSPPEEGTASNNTAEHSDAIRFACTKATIDGLSLTMSREGVDLPLPIGGKGVQSIRLSLLDYNFRNLYAFFYAWSLNFYNPHKRRFTIGAKGKYKNIQIDVYTAASPISDGDEFNYIRTQSITGVNCIIQDVPGLSLDYQNASPFSFDVNIVPTDVFFDFPYQGSLARGAMSTAASGSSYRDLITGDVSEPGNMVKP